MEEWNVSGVARHEANCLKINSIVSSPAESLCI